MSKFGIYAGFFDDDKDLQASNQYYLRDIETFP